MSNRLPDAYYKDTSVADAAMAAPPGMFWKTLAKACEEKDARWAKLLGRKTLHTPMKRATERAVRVTSPAGAPRPLGVPTPPSGPDLGFVTAAEFAAMEFPQNYLIDGILTEGQPHLNAGASKSMKTLVGVLDAGISLASATPFLGMFAVPKSINVGIVSAESGPATLQRNALTICEARGINLAGLPLHVTTTMPPLYDPASIRAIKAFIELNKVGVLFLDPLYLGLLDGKSANEASNLFAMGARLKELAQLIQETGVTLSLSHHCKKANRFDQRRFQPAELEDMAMAGFAEFARQWTLFSRREAYRQGTGLHQLWLNIGGSAGHSGLYAVDVDEGVPTSPRWHVTVKPAEDVYAEHAEQRAEERERKAANKESGKRAALVKDILAAAEEIGDWATRKRIRERAGKGNEAANETLFSDLVEDGSLEQEMQTVANRPTKVYRFLQPSVE